MKKHKLLVAIVLLLSLSGQKALAWDFSAVSPSGHTLYYSTWGASVYVERPSYNYESHSKPTGDLVIPSTVTNNGTTYTVVRIDDHTFRDCDSLTSVTLPTTVTLIGERAFYGCSRLTSITLPSGLTTIRAYAFNGCSALTQVSFPTTLTSIGNNAFGGCRQMPSFTVPATVTTIGTNAFIGARMLFYTGTATGAPWGAHYMNGYIEDSLYYTSNSKDSLVGSHPRVLHANIPGTVTYIGSYAFDAADNEVGHPLLSLSVPVSVVHIDGGAFYNCYNLDSLAWDVDSSSSFSFGSKPISQVVLGSNVRYVPNDFLYGDTHLLSVTFLGSPVTIGSEAFYGCKNLRNLSAIQASRVGHYAFYGCRSLPSLSVDAEVIEQYAFANCYSLSDVSLGSHVRFIDGGAFVDDSNLMEVTIPKGVDTLNGIVFSSPHMNVVHFNATRCSFALGSFACHVDTFVIGPQVQSVPDYLLSTSSVSHLILGNSLQIIGDYAFRCQGLTHVDIPASVTHIGTYAFESPNSESGDYLFIHLLGSTPPTFGTAPFDASPLYILTNIRLTVPCGATEAYQSDEYMNEWFQSDLGVYAGELCGDYYIFTNSNSLEMGQVEGAGAYSAGATAELRALPQTGYHFVQWSDGNTDNPRSLTVSGDAVIGAIFAEGEAVGVVSTELSHITLSTRDNYIIVHQAKGETVSIYDINGRILSVRQCCGDREHFTVPSTGVYIVRIGQQPAQRVVVVR